MSRIYRLPPSPNDDLRRNYAGVMSTPDAVEIERKFDVDESASLPAFEGLPGVDRVADPIEYELDALYFDTEDLALAHSRITLRRRTGGEDEGWHIKTLLDADARQELHEPLGTDPSVVPARLLRRVRVHVRDRALIPVVRLQTRRIVHRLLDAQGKVLAEVCDDRVHAERLLPGETSLSWREWEVELVSGDRDLLDAAQSLLATSGVTPSHHVSKLGRALGEPQRTPLPEGKGDAGTTFLAYFDANVRMLWREDPRVREDEADAVHQFRIALRRLRSALRTFRPIVDPEVANSLRGELKWMAGTLGTARDLQVLHERIRASIAEEPPGLVLGPLAARIDEQFAAELPAARRAGLTSLDDSRYFQLLDDLDAFVASPPFRGRASEPARRVVPELVKREWKRLRTRVRDSERASEGRPRDIALHEVRKGVKQLRYAAEASGPLGSKRASRLAGAAEEIQTILGDHQDSVVARQLLLRSAAEAHRRGEDGFTYGRLHAIEQRAATDAEERFRRGWKQFPRPSSGH